MGLGWIFLPPQVHRHGHEEEDGQPCGHARVQKSTEQNQHGGDHAEGSFCPSFHVRTNGS